MSIGSAFSMFSCFVLLLLPFLAPRGEQNARTPIATVALATQSEGGSPTPAEEDRHQTRGHAHYMHCPLGSTVDTTQTAHVIFPPNRCLSKKAGLFWVDKESRQTVLAEPLRASSPGMLDCEFMFSLRRGMCSFLLLEFTAPRRTGRTIALERISNSYVAMNEFEKKREQLQTSRQGRTASATFAIRLRHAVPFSRITEQSVPVWDLRPPSVQTHA